MHAGPAIRCSLPGTVDCHTICGHNQSPNQEAGQPGENHICLFAEEVGGVEISQGEGGMERGGRIGGWGKVGDEGGWDGERGGRIGGWSKVGDEGVGWRGEGLGGGEKWVMDQLGEMLAWWW